MNDKKEIFEVVNEHDVDYLILEEFWSSEDFRKWFLSILESNYGDLKFIFARHSFRKKAKNINSKMNQTDIRVDFVDSDDKEFVFLIENKMGHELADKQIMGYQIVKEEVSKEENIRVMSVLLAPENEKYLCKKDGFDFFVSYENLREFFNAKAQSSVRYWYKLNLLDVALNKSRRRGGQKKGEEKPIVFRKKYCAVFDEYASGLHCPVMEDATSQTLFINFKPDKFKEFGLKMRHKARPSQSNLDVEFSPSKYNLEEIEKYRRELSNYLGLPIDWVVARMASKSPALSVMVPGMDVNENWKSQEKKIVCIAKLANNFCNWIKNNVCK